MAIEVTYFTTPDGDVECERFASPGDVRHVLSVEGSLHYGAEDVTEGGVQRTVGDYPAAVQALIQDRWAEWCDEAGERDADGRAEFWAE